MMESQVDRELLEKIADLIGKPVGAFNIRKDTGCDGRQSTENIQITGKTDGKIFKADGKMQFAEKYFDNLSVTKGSDDFARPANVWKLKAEKIGTYADTADLTYTKSVDVCDIYKDLGLSSKIEKKDVSVYVDGVVDPENKIVPVAITKDNDDDSYGANGVLTSVMVTVSASSS